MCKLFNIYMSMGCVIQLDALEKKRKTDNWYYCTDSNVIINSGFAIRKEGAKGLREEVSI